MALKIEKRLHPRILVDWPVVVVTPQRYIGGETNNVSLGGAFIRCVSNPGAGEPLRIVFKAPSRERFLLFTAVVVWSNQYEQIHELFSTETGIRFTSFIGDSRLYLSQVISEHGVIEHDKEFSAD
ncbi:MAG: PilZ domain-containing protein [Deltaproteobacteria bacterium]|nr:MAG: PilZ domain-containing protein [Deltaproteobacteria bacterium]